MKKGILLLLALVILELSANAETKVWTGLSTNLPPRWDDPDNWKPSPPTDKDDVVIGEPPDSFRPHITVQGPIKLKSLYVNRTTLDGNAQFEVDTLTTKGLAVSGGGAIKILAGATINNGPTGEDGLAIYGWTINNEGLMTLTAGSRMFFYAQLGHFNNDGTLDLMDGSVIDGFGGGALFVNRGVIRKPLGTGKATMEFLQFANDGEFLVSSGSVSFPSGKVMNTGSMTIDGVNSIIFEGASVDLNGGALGGVGSFIARGNSVITVNVDTPINNLELGVNVTGPAKLTVQNNLHWTGGSLLGNGEVISVTQTTIEGADKIIRGRTFRNKNKTLWASGNITVDQGGRIENELTGEFTIGDIADKQISGSLSDPGGFFNTGVVKLVRQNGKRTSIYCAFNSSSRVEYGALLSFFGGGSLAGTFEQVGAFPDARWEILSGTNNFEDGFTSTSLNAVAIQNSVVNIRGNVKATRIKLNGGTLDGDGVLEVSDRFIWTSGVIRGAGILRALGAFDWDQFNASRDLLGRTIEIWGQGIWNQVNFSAGDGAMIRVMPGGELQAGAGEGLSWTTGALPILENNGRFVKSGGAGTAFITTGFLNKGKVVIAQGTLQLGAGYVQEAGSTEIDAATQLQLTKGMTNGMAGVIFGSGKIIGSVTNLGAIRPGQSPGLLTFNNDLIQTPTGHVQIELGGLEAGVTYDQIKLDGQAKLDGNLDIKLVPGFIPFAGYRFHVMTFGSRVGQFAVQNGDRMSNGLVLIPEYTATGLDLVALEPAMVLATLQLVSKTPDGAIWSWGATAGQKYSVQYSDDLYTWLVFTNLQAATTTAQLEFPNPGLPVVSRFYRLR